MTQSSESEGLTRRETLEGLVGAALGGSLAGCNSTSEGYERQSNADTGSSPTSEHSTAAGPTSSTESDYEGADGGQISLEADDYSNSVHLEQGGTAGLLFENEGDEGSYTVEGHGARKVQMSLQEMPEDDTSVDTSVYRFLVEEEGLDSRDTYSIEVGDSKPSTVGPATTMLDGDVILGAFKTDEDEVNLNLIHEDWA